MPHLLLIPFTAYLVSQTMKFFTGGQNGRLSLKSFFSYSGMPSTHTAIVVSFAGIIALEEGVRSPVFAMSLIFATIVIRDAVGIRQYLGQHSKVINSLVKDLNDDLLLDGEYPKLLERIGHTPAQVAVGALVGASISLVGWLLF
jgi:acid phosphatase family membrane protein YuiD